MQYVLFVGLVMLCCLRTAVAQDHLAQLLDPVVVTATRTSQKLSESLRDVSVITEEDLQKWGQSTLVEVLRTQPGLEVTSNGGMGATSNVFIRGAINNHTVVLVDGIRLSSATLGTTAFENIPVSQIEHIEILRGVGSSLYGADAIGGVIQIFTKRGEGAPRPIQIGRAHV